jgi:hypothetical protein
MIDKNYIIESVLGQVRSNIQATNSKNSKHTGNLSSGKETSGTSIRSELSKDGIVNVNMGAEQVWSKKHT